MQPLSLVRKFAVASSVHGPWDITGGFPSEIVMLLNTYQQMQLSQHTSLDRKVTRGVAINEPLSLKIQADSKVPISNIP